MRFCFAVSLGELGSFVSLEKVRHEQSRHFICRNFIFHCFGGIDFGGNRITCLVSNTMIELEPGEKILMEVRKHWFIFFIHSIFSLFLVILPPLVYQVVTSRFVPIEVAIPDNVFYLGVFLYILWLLMIWIGFFIQWTDYYLDVWYITDRRIFDVLQKGFFHRQVSIVRLERIQDITVEIKGVIPTFLDYGKVHIQTAGENSQDFVIMDSGHPNEVKQLISDLHSKVMAAHRGDGIVS